VSVKTDSIAIQHATDLWEGANGIAHHDEFLVHLEMRFKKIVDWMLPFQSSIRVVLWKCTFRATMDAIRLYIIFEQTFGWAMHMF
jgi:hypothetical protein